MTFARDKRLLLGWLALLAPLPLPFNQVVAWPYLAAYWLVVVLFLRRASRDRQASRGWLPTWAMNVLALAYLPYFLFDLFVLSRGRLVASVSHLLLFTVLVKLFALRRERDKWQAFIAISFLFLASMATSVHPTVVLYLLAYLVLTLRLFARFAQFHLLAGERGGGDRGGDRAGPPAGGRPALHPGLHPMGRFLVWATLGTVLLSVPLFALLPRVRTPFIMGPGGGVGTLGSTTGFSDMVTLDSIGSIRSSREVAMRLRYEGGMPIDHELRYKAGAFETYDSGVWRPLDQEFRVEPQGDGWFPLVEGPAGFWVQVYLRPVTGRALPVPVETLVVEGDFRMVLLDQNGVVRRPVPGLEVQEYRVGLAGAPVSRAQPPRLGDGTGPPPAVLDTTEVSDRVAALAEQVAGEGPPLEQARRIERYLSTAYDYSLDWVGRPGVDPLEDFLFERREGHCEYFASAMVMMLRSRGIPARLATGFLGAEYNPLEGYYIVRQSNAHAWVEGYIPDQGWRVFDPTPPSGRPAVDRSGLGLLMSQAWDYVLFRWDRYILTYGFVDQVRVFSFLRDAWSDLWSRFQGDDEEPAEVAAAEEAPVLEVEGAEEPWARSRGGLWVLWCLLAVLALAAAFWAWRRLRRPLTGRVAYRRLRRRAARAGFDPGPTAPPLGFRDGLGERFPAAAEAGAAVVDLYVRERYAERPLEADDRRRLGEALGAAEKALGRAG